MKATVFANDNIIGITDLIVGDKSMGHVYGILTPNEYYFNHIQKYVWDFWKTSMPDYDQWNSLNIKVQLDNGHVLQPAGGITIDEIEELPNEPKQINISGINIEAF